MTTIRPQAPRYAGVVDLRRCPINDPASPEYRVLVQACRDQLRDSGVAGLAGFFTPAAVGRCWPWPPVGLPGVGEQPGPHRLFRTCR